MNDTARRLLNLILAPMMWVCSSLGFIFEGARSPADMSDTNTSLLVPFGAAFSIWLPIFALCIGYGIVQALPKNKERDVFRSVGGWSAAGFAGVCLWGIVNAFGPAGNLLSPPFDLAQWGTAIVFVPTMLLLVKAMLIATARKDELAGVEKIVTLGGLSMIAGWCSLAVFLNWAPQIVAGFERVNVPDAWSCAGLLLVVLTWAVHIANKSNGNGFYMFPIIWGLGFTLYKLLFVSGNDGASLVAIAAGATLGVFIGVYLSNLKPRPVQTKIWSFTR